MKDIYLSFVTGRMDGGGDPSTWKFGSNWPRWSEIADI